MKKVLFIALAVFLLLVSCDGDVGDAFFPALHTVTFDASNGDVWAVRVEEGNSVAEPEEPVRYDWVFLGWLSGDVHYDFSAPVTEDLLLTASWKKKIHYPTTVRLSTELDGEPADTRITMSSEHASFMLDTKDGTYLSTSVPPGIYNVLYDNMLCGTFDVLEEEYNTYSVRLFSVAVSGDDMITEFSGEGIYPDGHTVHFDAEAAYGWDVAGWNINGVIYDATPVDMEITEPVEASVSSMLHRWKIGFTNSEEATYPGRVGLNDDYALCDVDQWLDITWPVMKGHTVLSSYPSCPGEENVRIEDGFLVIPAGTIGDIDISVTWKPEGSPVSVTVAKDGLPWSDAPVSLSASDGIYESSEAEVSDGVMTWSNVGYGPVSVLYLDEPTGISDEVKKDVPVETGIVFATVSVTGDEGTAFVEGDGLYIVGHVADLSVIPSEDYEFVSWNIGDTPVSDSRQYSFTVTETTMLNVATRSSTWDIRPLEGKIFYENPEYNGAEYRLYDSDGNMTSVFADAVSYAVSGAPEFTKYLMYREAGEGIWGAYGLVTGAVADGMGAGIPDTKKASESGYTEEGTVWDLLEPGTYVGSKAEYDVLFSAYPEFREETVWSSVEKSRYSALIHLPSGWVEAGKNTSGKVLLISGI